MKMDNVKIGLIGAIVVLAAFNIYQISSVRSEMEVMQQNLEGQIKAATITGGTAQNSVNPNTNVNPNLSNNNNLPQTQVKQNNQPTTAISFAEEVHNFGSVEVESENLYAFTFTNTGSEPLIISNAKGSCGCTVPNWPKEPIMPGKTGQIDVKFTPNVGQVGQEVEKVVTVTANTNPESTMVRIKANVTEKK